MRTAGRFPNYPLPLDAALERYRHLRARVARLEEEIATWESQPKRKRRPLKELWGERDGWAEELSDLDRAFKIISAIDQLPRCGCGKIAHPTEDDAQTHMWMLRIVSRTSKPVSTLNVYRCPRVSHNYHVGHASEPITLTDAT